MLGGPRLYDSLRGDPSASSGNPIVPTEGAPVVDWFSTLPMDLWYPDIIKYELVVSSDFDAVSTLLTGEN